MWLMRDLEGLPVKWLGPSHSRESGQPDSPAGHDPQRDDMQTEQISWGLIQACIRALAIFQECLLHRLQGLTWLLSLQRLSLCVP